MAEREPTRTGLRLAAVALLLAAQLGALAANVRIRGATLARHTWTAAVMSAGLLSRPPAGPPDTTGTIEGYGDGTIVVLTVGGYETVRVDATTVIARPAGPAAMSELRPGAAAAISGQRSLWRSGLTARALLVFGG